MADSDDDELPASTETSSESEDTVLMVLQPIDQQVGAESARNQLLSALGDLGFACGPVVGGICAVTGPRTQIQAFKDHAEVLNHDYAVEGANEELLALMRPCLVSVVEDEPVETFPSTIDDSHGNATEFGSPESGSPELGPTGFGAS